MTKTKTCNVHRDTMECYAEELRIDGTELEARGSIRMSNRMKHRLSVEGKYWKTIEDQLNGAGDAPNA